MNRVVRLLPPDLFEHTFTLVPRVAVCLQIRGPKGEILLARRSSSMATMPGAWHYPGAFLLLNESIPACIDRIALKELGASATGTPNLVGVFEDLDGDPRGHVIDLVYELQLDAAPVQTDETDGLRFFGSIPEGVAFYHDRIMRASGLT